jgi:hypothetical protein
LVALRKNPTNYERYTTVLAFDIPGTMFIASSDQWPPKSTG